MSVGLCGACGRQPWSLPLLQLQSCPGKSSLPSGESQDQHAGHDVMLTWEIALVPTVPSRVHGNTALKKYQPWPLKYALTIFFLT